MKTKLTLEETTSDTTNLQEEVSSLAVLGGWEG